MVELTCRHKDDVLRQYCSEYRRIKICCGRFRSIIGYFKKEKEFQLSMTWTRVFIQRGVNNVWHSSMKIRHHYFAIPIIDIYLPRYLEARNKLMPTKNIPGPKGLPLVGNLFRFMPYIGEYHNVNDLTLLRMLRDKYGNIVKFDSPTKERSCILLFCPELCKSMYHSQGKWPMRIIVEPLRYYRKSRKDIFNGEYGLVTSQGKSWQNFRSKVNPYMLRPNITHVKQIYEVASEFVDKMRKLRDPTTLELPNDFINELNKWSLESKCSFVLNYKPGYLKPNLTNSEQTMINCMQEVTKLFCRLENTSFLWKVIKMWNLKKLFRAMDTFHAISGKYIEYAETKFMKKTNETNSEDRCVLENLLYVDRQTAHIMAWDTLMNIDAVSNAAGALLYHIANNPKKQEKLREELMSVLPDKTMPITHDILERIPYVKACIKESLRLFPICNATLRTMEADVTIGRYVISKGTDVLACHAVMSMDPRYFLQPEEFIPERWMRDSPEFPLYKRSHPFAYMPFGYCVRSCIGQRFVEIELEMLLLNVIQNFRIEWHHGPLEYETLIQNVVKSPLQLKLIDL